MAARAFFHAGPGVNTESRILDCYRLAHFYKIDPDIFLNRDGQRRGAPFGVDGEAV